MRVQRTLLTIPPNFFAIPAGLAGLAGVWRYASVLYAAPAIISEALFLTAGGVYLLLALTVLARLVLAPRTLVADLVHPVLGPFTALLPITGMLLALGLVPHAREAGMVLFLIGLAATFLLGGWLTGQWIVAGQDADTIHPGYFLPTVAGAFVAANGAATLGFPALGWLSFGIGLICWMMVGAVIINRLLTRPRLPAALLPTLAISLAPPVVGGNAYFALNGDTIDPVAYLLAGYALLMVLVQLRLVPLYRRTPFVPSYWSFTFPFAAAASYALRWLNITHSREPLIGWVVTATVTMLIGSIALRSLLALGRGTFLAAANAAPTSPAEPNYVTR